MKKAVMSVTAFLRTYKKAVEPREDLHGFDVYFKRSAVDAPLVEAPPPPVIQSEFFCGHLS
jgi:hypothetical protein